MKLIIKPMFLTFFLMISMISCNNEELFVEPIAEVVDDPTSPEDTDFEVPQITTPCEFNLDNVQPNSTVIINCVMDLGGKTIVLPSNVKIIYEGGDIVNGTLSFSNDNVISGELMNNTVDMEGSNPQLKDTEFIFEPKRWGIVEGKVTSAVALKNRDILEKKMLDIKKLGINIFKIDKMDAYFEVSLVTSGTTNRNFYPSIEAINVPGDFNLVMTSNTHLRVQPNSNKNYSLMAVREVENVTIKGGNLYGDRNEHNYSSGGTHEWGHVMSLHAAVNTVIDNVKMKDGSGDGLKIHSLRFSFEPDYAPSHNIIVRNCTFDSNRRNNISVTDGFDITLENNLLLNAGIDTQKSKGTKPKFGIDVEAVRASDNNGGYIFYEKAERILIRNNTERGSAGGAITVHIGQYVTIEGNKTEKSISYTYTNGTKIKNNTITASDSNISNTAISAGTSSETTTSVYNNEISGNTITGFGVAINVKNKTTNVFGNILNDNVVGILPNNLTDSKIYNNKINSNKSSSKGIFINTTKLNNVVFENNDIYALQNAIKITNLNTTTDSKNNKVTFKNNKLKSPSYTQLSKANNVIFEKNNFDHGIEVYDSNKISFLTNTITTAKHEGVYLRNINTGITLNGNTIDVATNRLCLKIASTTILSNIINTNTICK